MRVGDSGGPLVGKFDVTVVIPAHNAAETVGRAIESALAQTQKPHAIIVVDDGSTDATKGLARQYAPLVSLLHREEAGPGGYAARNEGVLAAHSDWIAFLDADDEWTREHLSSLSQLSGQLPQAAMLSSGWITRLPDGATVPNRYTRLSERSGSHELDLRQFLRQWAAGRAPIWTSAACVRRELLMATGGFPAGRCSRGGDVDTWLRAMLECGRMGYHPRCTAVYHRDTATSVTKRLPPQLSHCTEQTVARALKRMNGAWLRHCLKRLGNRHKMDPMRKRARAGTLRFRQLKGLYAAANPLFYVQMAVLATVPRVAVLLLLTLRDRAVTLLKKRRG